MKKVAYMEIAGFITTIIFIIMCPYNICAQDESKMININHMEDRMYWGTYNDTNSSLEVTSELAYKNNGIRASYDLARDGWVGFYRSIDPSKLSGVTKVGYHCKGGGAPNSIEFKVKDKDNYTFVYICNNATVSDDWRYIEASEEDFRCWWDVNGDPCEKRVNLSEIVEIGFAISNKVGDTPGKGYVIIDEIEGVPEPPKPPEPQWDKIIIIFSLVFVLSMAIILYLGIRGINAVILAAIVTAVASLLIAFLGFFSKI